jgi:hypothetical protein
MSPIDWIENENIFACGIALAHHHPWLGVVVGQRSMVCAGYDFAGGLYRLGSD